MKKIALIAMAVALVGFVVAGTAFESFAAGLEVNMAETVAERGQD